MENLGRWVRHLWLDLGDLRPVLPDHLAQQLARQIAASNRHAEALRLCIDGSLPPGKVWQAGSTQARWLLVRRRALGWFSRLTIMGHEAQQRCADPPAAGRTVCQNSDRSRAHPTRPARRVAGHHRPAI